MHRWAKRVKGPQMVDITPDLMYSLSNSISLGVTEWKPNQEHLLQSPLMNALRENEQLNELMLKFLKAELTLRNANALDSTGIPDYTKTVGHAKPSNLILRPLITNRNAAFEEYEIMRRLICGDVDHYNVVQLKIFFV